MGLRDAFGARRAAEQRELTEAKAKRTLGEELLEELGIEARDLLTQHEIAPRGRRDNFSWGFSSNSDVDRRHFAVSTDGVLLCDGKPAHICEFGGCKVSRCRQSVFIYVSRGELVYDLKAHHAPDVDMLGYDEPLERKLAEWIDEKIKTAR